MATLNEENVEPPSPPLAGNAEPTTEDTISYGERLSIHATALSIDGPRFILFQHLQKINILNLQHELLKQHIALYQHSTIAEQDLENLNSTLQRYTSAIRDYEYMLRLPWRSCEIGDDYVRQIRETFPWISSSTDVYDMYGLSTIDLPHKSATNLPTDPLREWLKRILPKGLTYTQTEKERQHSDYMRGKEPIELSPFVDKLARFTVAMTGGLSLVVPVLIMRLHENLTKSLTTVSVAVVLFSAVTSMIFKASNTETLAATATYAAVLVVFVGASGSGG
jgi:hypothetical protein